MQVGIGSWGSPRPRLRERRGRKPPRDLVRLPGAIPPAGLAGTEREVGARRKILAISDLQLARCSPSTRSTGTRLTWDSFGGVFLRLERPPSVRSAAEMSSRRVEAVPESYRIDELRCLAKASVAAAGIVRSVTGWSFLNGSIDELSQIRRVDETIAVRTSTVVAHAGTVGLTPRLRRP